MCVYLFVCARGEVGVIRRRLGRFRTYQASLTRGMSTSLYFAYQKVSVLDLHRAPYNHQHRRPPTHMPIAAGEGPTVETVT